MPKVIVTILLPSMIKQFLYSYLFDVCQFRVRCILHLLLCDFPVILARLLGDDAKMNDRQQPSLNTRTRRMQMTWLDDKGEGRGVLELLQQLSPWQLSSICQ